MNKLSWFLYLADVGGNFSTLFEVVSFFGIIIGVLLKWHSFVGSDWDFESNGLSRKIERFHGNLLLCVGLFLVILACLTPSKETIYAVAASQEGEQLLKAPIVGKAERALDAWLNAQIAKSEAAAGKGS